MNSERELKFLAAVWALRGILTRAGFKKFKLKDGLVGSDKGELEDLLDYLKAKETPATVQLLSANSRTTIEKGVEAVTLTRNGVFFKNFAQLGKLLKLTVAERDILLFVMLWREEPGLRQALDELYRWVLGFGYFQVVPVERIAGPIPEEVQKARFPKKPCQIVVAAVVGQTVALQTLLEPFYGGLALTDHSGSFLWANSDPSPFQAGGCRNERHFDGNQVVMNAVGGGSGDLAGVQLGRG